MKNYSVTFEKDFYNPFKTYPQNANRYAGSRAFETLQEAQAFAGTVKAATVYYLGVPVRK